MDTLNIERNVGAIVDRLMTGGNMVIDKAFVSAVGDFLEETADVIEAGVCSLKGSSVLEASSPGDERQVAQRLNSLRRLGHEFRKLELIVAV